MFNQQSLHPWYDLNHFQEESQQCNELLEEWIQDSAKVSAWGTLIIRKSTDDFPSKMFSCCIASSQESPNEGARASFSFDAMALAPNMDLLMSCKDAERVAQTIAHWNCGKPRTERLELIRPPGSNMSPRDVGTADWNVHVQKEAQMLFRYQSLTSTTTRYNQEQRRVDREGVMNILKATENSLFTHMAILNTQMGANLRAYHYL